MQRLITLAAVLALAPLADAQSLGEVSAAMGVHDAAAGAGMSSAKTASHVRDKIKSHLSTGSKAWQPASRSERHSADSGWSSSAGSARRGARTSAGWATAHAGGGWARRDSPAARRR